MPERIIEADRSIVFGADIDPDKFQNIVAQIAGVEGLGGIKIGFEVGLGGPKLSETAQMIRDADPGLKVIYDHQKGGTDIPATGENFGRTMQKGQVDAAIIFPFTGPTTQERWTRQLQDHGIGVITGAEMTHENVVASRDGLSGGYIHPEAFKRMFGLAIDLDVQNFVVPGNKPGKVTEYRNFFDQEIGPGGYTLWAPGFVTQGGDLTETGKLAGPNFHAIVGSGIYNAANPSQAAYNLGQKILNLGRA